MSEDIDKLSPMAEILFYRLIVKADDYGAYYGNPAIVKSNCFPLKSDEQISRVDVGKWIAELESAGLIDAYKSGGRDYIQFHKWKNHQQIRAKKRRFPEPDSNCNQMISDDSKCPRNPIQSNPIRIQSESNPKGEDDQDRFEEFWAAYPKKSGDIREAYFEYLGAIQGGVSEDMIIEAVKAQAAAKEARYFPSADKWLRNKGWTEKVETPKKQAAVVTGDYGKVDLDALMAFADAMGGEKDE